MTLRDSALNILDVVSYGSEGGTDVSLTRFPDATGSFAKHTTVNPNAFSPGRTVDGQLALPHQEPVRAPAIPEPLSMALFGGGLIVLPRLRRRQRSG